MHKLLVLYIATKSTWPNFKPRALVSLMSSFNAKKDRSFLDKGDDKATSDNQRG